MRIPDHIRPPAVAFRNIAADREADAMRDIQREGQLGETLQKMGMPEQMVDAAVAQVRAMREGSRMDDLPQTMKGLMRNIRENMGYCHAGKHLERGENGTFKLWDFDEIADRCIAIELDADGMILAELPDGGSYEIGGVAAQAFLRYLHFAGIFGAIKAREKCPKCGTLPEPGDCTRCGGLGWVVEDSSESESLAVLDAEFTE